MQIVDGHAVACSTQAAALELHPGTQSTSWVRRRTSDGRRPVKARGAHDHRRAGAPAARVRKAGLSSSFASREPSDRFRLIVTVDDIIDQALAKVLHRLAALTVSEPAYAVGLSGT